MQAVWRSWIYIDEQDQISYDIDCYGHICRLVIWGPCHDFVLEFPLVRKHFLRHLFLRK